MHSCSEDVDRRRKRCMHTDTERIRTDRHSIGDSSCSRREIAKDTAGYRFGWLLNGRSPSTCLKTRGSRSAEGHVVQVIISLFCSRTHEMHCCMYVPARRSTPFPLSSLTHVVKSSKQNLKSKKRSRILRKPNERVKHR